MAAAIGIGFVLAIVGTGAAYLYGRWVRSRRVPAQRRVRPPRAEEYDLAAVRYEHCSARDSYEEARDLRRVA